MASIMADGYSNACAACDDDKRQDLWSPGNRDRQLTPISQVAGDYQGLLTFNRNRVFF
jgi:hypothetical protein